MKVNKVGGSILLSKNPNQPSFWLLFPVTNVNSKKPSPSVSSYYIYQYLHAPI